MKIYLQENDKTLRGERRIKSPTGMYRLLLLKAHGKKGGTKRFFHPESLQFLQYPLFLRLLYKHRQLSYRLKYPYKQLCRFLYSAAYSSSFLFFHRGKIFPLNFLYHRNNCGFRLLKSYFISYKDYLLFQKPLWKFCHARDKL